MACWWLGKVQSSHRSLGALRNPTAQYLEGVQCLFIDMRVETGTPTLYCDNRAAVHLSSGSSEWRTKAFVNRILGAKSLIELRQMIVIFRPTLKMEADLLTKFI